MADTYHHASRACRVSIWPGPPSIAPPFWQLQPLIVSVVVCVSGEGRGVERNTTRSGARDHTFDSDNQCKPQGEETSG